MPDATTRPDRSRRRTVALVVALVLGLLATSLAVASALQVWGDASNGALPEPSGEPRSTASTVPSQTTGSPGSPSPGTSPPATAAPSAPPPGGPPPSGPPPSGPPPSGPPPARPGADTYTVYAHPPISAKETTPQGYVEALQDRSAWADGLFLYYPARLAFGARPEIDALQEAYPDGVPLTVSAKNADPAGIAAFRDQLTPQQAAVTLWERWQEPADDFVTPAARAEFRELVLSDIELLRPAGIRVGVHEQCWTLDPANRQPWASERALQQLIPPEVDIVTATCLGFSAADSGEAQMTRFLDFMAEHYPGMDVGFTSLSWSVPGGTPMDSPVRAERAEAAREAVEFAAAAGVTEFGWFDFADWEGRDSDVNSDPALRDLLSELSARPVANP